MSTASTPPLAVARISTWRQFNALTKPRVIQLIVFCALIGMVLAVPGVPSWMQVQQAAVACLGIWLVAGAAAAFNCVVEQRIDAKMKRTAWRPTAKGELTNTQTLAFSATLCAIGSAILYVLVNPLTMWLTFATFVGYAVIYTVVLKPLTPQNIVIGGASGAMPPVLGWAAMTGDVGPEAAILLAGALYDADKFRFGPDIFATTLWELCECDEWSLEQIAERFAEGPRLAREFAGTFRTREGRRYGPQLMAEGLVLAEEFTRMLASALASPKEA